MRSSDKKHVEHNRANAEKVSVHSKSVVADNRSASVAQAKLAKDVEKATVQQNRPVQKKENKTGLPDHLKSGIENLSGHAMDHVKVHYNSDKPAQLQAHAYAQGSEIHVAPGQEKHLPHEAWHVVQQKQGRVKATTQMKGVGVNDSHALEHEADVMGAKALKVAQPKTIAKAPAQLMEDEEETEE